MAYEIIIITFKGEKEYKYAHFNARHMFSENLRMIEIFQKAIKGQQLEKIIWYNLDEIKKIEIMEGEQNE